MAPRRKTTKPSGTVSDAETSPPIDNSEADAFAVSTAGTQRRLQVLVFVSGGVLMGLEIAGSRILAPHFGNSIFVWGSLISVFLMALSFGYYVGGRVADRFPSWLLLNSICVLSALAMLIVAFVSDPVAGWIVNQGFGDQSGPFVASVLLFLIPGAGMGVVSPFAIRLATSSVSSVGKSSGTLYAFSTLGSIVGTLLTTFVLIPNFGLTAILKGLSIALLVTAAVTLPGKKRRDRVAGVVGVAACVLLCLLPAMTSSAGQLRGLVLEDADTPYHHITVVSNRGIRELRFDQFVETAVREDPPYVSEAHYTDYFHLALLAKPDLKSSVFIGAGGGVGPRTFHAHAPEMQIDMVDIDPKILEVARDYFYLEDSPFIHPVAEDGRMFLRKADAKYDCIVLDAFTIGGRIPFHLVTQEFMNICHERMLDQAVFVMNVNSAIQGPRSRIFQSMYRTLDSVFDQTYVFAMGHRIRGIDDSTNVMLVATKGLPKMTAEKWEQAVATYESNSYVGRPRMTIAVNDLLSEVPDVSAAPLFTDEYAPIETMPF